MRKPHFILRGNSVPETAFTVGTVMLIFYGAIKLALTGYEQAEVDGASFVAAHAASLDPANESRGVAKATNDFKHVTGGIAVNPDTSQPGANGNGNVVGLATRAAEVVFGSGSIALNSHVIEPVVGTYVGANSNLHVDSATLQNCDTNNQATPNAASCAMTLAAPSPTNSADPYTNYECRLANYIHLVRSPGQNTQYFKTASPGGYRYTNDHPWPDSYRIDTGGSINDPHVRGDINHQYWTPTNNNYNGTSYYINQNFTLGTIVSAVYNQGPAYTAAAGYGACP